MRLLTASPDAAEGPGEGCAATKPRDSYRRVGGASAAGDDEFACRYFGAGGREVLHAHDDVLHGDAGAENFWFLRRALNQS